MKKKEGVTAKTGKVVKQNPKPGKILAPGSKVSVKLGGWLGAWVSNPGGAVRPA